MRDRLVGALGITGILAFLGFFFWLHVTQNGGPFWR